MLAAQRRMTQRCQGGAAAAAGIRSAATWESGMPLWHRMFGCNLATRSPFARAGSLDLFRRRDYFGESSHGSLMSRYSGAPTESDIISSIIFCASGGISFCSPFRASSSLVK